MKCTARIKPFEPLEVECELESHHSDIPHSGVIRNYAYPGSETALNWFESDRRNYHGEFIGCPQPFCSLPINHTGDHVE